MGIRVPCLGVSSVKLRDISTWMILPTGCLSELYWPTIAQLVKHWHVKLINWHLSPITGLDIFHSVEINKFSHMAYIFLPINSLKYLDTRHALSVNFQN